MMMGCDREVFVERILAHTIRQDPLLDRMELTRSLLAKSFQQLFQEPSILYYSARHALQGHNNI